MTDCKPDRLPLLNISSICGTYHLSNLTVRVGDGPEESIYYLVGENGRTQRLIRLNPDNTLLYITRRRNNSFRKQYSGFWSLQENNRIEIDGDCGTITRFDGRLLQITSSEQSGFETLITATYTRQTG